MYFIVKSFPLHSYNKILSNAFYSKIISNVFLQQIYFQHILFVRSFPVYFLIKINLKVFVLISATSLSFFYWRPNNFTKRNQIS